MQNILFAMRILQRFICEHLDHHYENIRRKITGKYYYTAGILHSKRSSFFSLSISLSPLAQPRKQIIFISQQNARVAIPSHFFVPWITRWKGGANGVLEIVNLPPFSGWNFRRRWGGEGRLRFQTFRNMCNNPALTLNLISRFKETKRNNIYILRTYWIASNKNVKFRISIGFDNFRNFKLVITQLSKRNNIYILRTYWIASNEI